MAGLDDVRLQVSIDHEALEAEAKLASELLGRSLSNQAGQTGSGTSSPAGLAPGGVNTQVINSLGKQEQLLKQVVKALESLVKVSEHETQLAESRIRRTPPSASQGGSVEPRTPTSAPEGAPRGDSDPFGGAEEGGGGGGRRRGGFLDSRGRPRRGGGGGGFGGAIAHGLYAANNFGMGVHAGGGSDSSIISGMGDIAMMGASYTPWALPVAGALKAWSASAQDTEKWMDIRSNLYREVGDEGRKAFHYTSMSDISKPESMVYSPYAYGLSSDDQGQLMRGLGKATGRFGMRDTGAFGGKWMAPGSDVVDLMKLQGFMGMGTEGTSLMGSMERSGTRPEDYDTIGAAIGIAIASELERGRFGETFGTLTKALNSMATGKADVDALLTREAFIGMMGGQYRGDTAAHGSATQTIESLASGQGSSFAEHMSLKAAGFGKGSSYFEARFKQARGLDKKGGVSTQQVITTYADMPHIKRMWDDGKKEQAALFIADHSGTNAGVVYDILESYYGGKMKAAGDARSIIKAGREAFDDTGAPEKDFAPRRKKFQSEAEGWLKIWGGQSGTWGANPTLEQSGSDVRDPYSKGAASSSLLKSLGLKLSTNMDGSGNKLATSDYKMPSDAQIAALGGLKPMQLNTGGLEGMWPKRYGSESSEGGIPFKGTRTDSTGGTEVKQTLTESEIKAIQDQADRLGVPFDWLWTMVRSESGGDPASRHKHKDPKKQQPNAGLLGFSLEFQEKYGYTPDTLKNASFEEQMKMVGDFYEPAFSGKNRDKMQEPADMKVFGFWPDALGAGDDYIMSSKTGESSYDYSKKAAAWNAKNKGKGRRDPLTKKYRNDWKAEDVSQFIYEANEGSDRTGGPDGGPDGKITVGEIKEHYRKYYEQGQKNKEKVGPQSINLNIRVEDGRVSITKQASLPKSIGAPGQLTTIPVRLG